MKLNNSLSLCAHMYDSTGNESPLVWIEGTAKNVANFIMHNQSKNITITTTDGEFVVSSTVGGVVNRVADHDIQHELFKEMIPLMTNKIEPGEVLYRNKKEIRSNSYIKYKLMSDEDKTKIDLFSYYKIIDSILDKNIDNRDECIDGIGNFVYKICSNPSYDKKVSCNEILEELTKAINNKTLSLDELINHYSVDRVLDFCKKETVEIKNENSYESESFDYIENVNTIITKEKTKSDEIKKVIPNSVHIAHENKKVMKKKKKSSTSVMTYILLCLLFMIVIAVGILGYFHRETIYKSMQNIELQIHENIIELNVGDEFVASDYIIHATKGDGIIHILPTYFNTNELGDFKLDYVLTNNLKTISKVLHVRVLDKTLPTIELIEDSITLVRKRDDFIAEEYIKHYSDNYDKDPTLDIDVLDWDKNEQTIVYTVIDSSGNKSSEALTVYIKDPQPVVYIDPNAESDTQSNIE